MADFAKCNGGDKPSCPFKYSCKRFTAPAAPHWQSFLEAPYNPITHSCKSFWDNRPVKLAREGKG